MRRTLLAGAALLAACGGDGGMGPPESRFASVAGTYRGPIASGRMEGTLKLVIEQKQGELEGTFATSVKEGVVWVQGWGTITGTISRGTTPAVTFRLEAEDCLHVTEWEGTYDTTTKSFTLTGDFLLHSGLPWCFTINEYASVTVVLRR